MRLMVYEKTDDGVYIYMLLPIVYMYDNPVYSLS